MVVFISGVGGYLPYQAEDWDKHNLVIDLLIQNPWPFTISVEDRQFTLSYYNAYHLLPALAGKVGGWPAANFVLLAQTSLGIAAAILLARAVTGVSIAFLLVATLCLTGIDLIPNVVRSLAGYGSFGEWWARAFSYSNNIHQLLYLPNQAIVGWTGAALILQAHRNGQTLQAAAFVVPVSLLWASFVTIGLAVLALPLWLLETSDNRLTRRLKSQLRTALPDLALGALVGLPSRRIYPCSSAST